MRKREKEIDKIINTYQKEFPQIDRKIAKKIKLLQSQGFKDIYTGSSITVSDIFENKVNQDHIIPRSLGGLSTEYNLVITHRNNNTRKSNRLPMDWLGGKDKYINRVEQLFKEGLIDWRKRKNLLARTLDEAFVEQSDTKGIRTTSYLEALVMENLKMFYPFRKQQHRKNGIAVRNIPGKTTSQARKLFGIKTKERETNFHHAEDALILATLREGWQKRLHDMLKKTTKKVKKSSKHCGKNTYRILKA